MRTIFQILFWASFGLLAYSYLLYPLILSFLVRLFRRPVRTNDALLPTVAVLVPVFNEEAIIRSKIENILALDYPADRLAVWVGSDCSTDATDRIVRGFSDTRVHLWIAPRRGGKTEVLNHMIPAVDAEVIVFTDANTMHCSDSIRKLVRAFADPSVGGVAGSIRHRSSKKEVEERLYRYFEAKQKFMESQLHSSISAFGGFYSVRRQLFEPIPYNSYSNDDVLIPMNIIRRGLRVVFEPEAVSEEDMTESITHEFARRIRIGAGNFQAFFWLLDFLNPLRGWPWFCYLSHKVSRWFSPFLILTGMLSSIALWMLHTALIYAFFSIAGLSAILVGLTYFIVPLRMNRPLYYFMSMNLALFLGLIRYCAGIKSAAWSRTERRTAVKR